LATSAVTHPAAGKPDAMDTAMPRNSVRANAFRRWLVGAILFAAAAAMPVRAQAQVVVVANGSPITAYDIEQRMKLDQSTTHKKPSRQEVIQELIDDRLKIAKAKSYGLEVSDEDVNKAFNNMAARQHITVQQFIGFLSRAGIAPQTIKARVRADLTWNELVRGKFSASLQVNESEIARAMRANNEQGAVGYIYTLYPVTVVVPSGSSEAVVASKKREAENLRARFVNCKQGLEFARALRDVAVREPIARSSADFAPQLRELLDKMEVGHLTTPEVTGQGLQMFAVCEKKPSKTVSPAERELRNQIFAKRFQSEAQKYLEEIRKSAMIEYKEAK
jgi:peptidyl-prolyl cis-trans isomerase SurA